MLTVETQIEKMKKSLRYMESLRLDLKSNIYKVEVIVILS